MKLPCPFRSWLIGLTAVLVGAAVLAAPKPAPKRMADKVPVTVSKFEAAEALYQDDHIPEALAAFRKLKTDRDFKISTLLPQVYAYEGWCCYLLKQYPAAIAAFDKLVKDYPDSLFASEAQLKRAECYREMKDYTKALATYKAFLVKHPRNPRVRPEEDPYRKLRSQAWLGHVWVLTKKVAQSDKPNLRPAKAILQSLMTEYRDEPAVILDSLFLQGLILNMERNYDGARATYSEIVKMRNDPHSATAIFLAAESMWDAKKYEDAISFYRSVQSKPAVVSAISSQLARLAGQKAAYLQQFGRLDDYETRVATLEHLLKKFQSDVNRRPAALLRIGNCYQILDKPEEASVVYQYILETYPLAKLSARERSINEAALHHLTQVLTERKQMAQARAMTERFKKDFPNSALGGDNTFMEAETQYGSKDFVKAVRNYEKARAKTVNPQMLEIINFRIPACYFEMGQFEKAITEFATFRTKQPTSEYAAASLFLDGRAHFMIYSKSATPEAAKPHLSEAIKSFEEVRSKYPKYENMALLTFQLGYLYGYSGSFDFDQKTGKLTTTANFIRAIAAYTEFLEKWPETKNDDDQVLAPEAWLQIGQCQAALLKPEEALKAYQSLIEKHPDSPLAAEAAYSIGGIYSALKKPAEMIAALRSYIEKHPHHEKVAAAIFLIARQLEAEKKFAEATVEYRSLIAKAAAKLDNEALVASAIGAQLNISKRLFDKDPQTAIADCETFLNQFKAHPVAARTMISEIRGIYFRTKQFAAGYTKLEQLASQYPDVSAIRLAGNTAVIELALGAKDYRRATTALLRLQADPEKDNLPPQSYAAMGNTHLRTGKPAEARDLFDKMLNQAKDDPKMIAVASLGLGQAYVELQQYDKAEPLLAPLQADPNCPFPIDAKTALAKVYAGTNKHKEAVRLCREVIAGSRSDQSSEAAFILGNIFFNNLVDSDKSKDNKKVALACYMRLAFVAGPMADEASFRAAQCHQALGNVEMARTAYKLHVARFKDGKFARPATEALEKLPPPVPQP